MVDRKGHTNFTIAMAATLVVEAIAMDTHRTKPLSVCLDGLEGISDVCLSLPVVVAAEGIVRVLHPDLGPEESAAVHRCAETARQGIADSSGECFVRSILWGRESICEPLASRQYCSDTVLIGAALRPRSGGHKVLQEQERQDKCADDDPRQPCIQVTLEVHQ